MIGRLLGRGIGGGVDTRARKTCNPTDTSIALIGKSSRGDGFANLLSVIDGWEHHRSYPAIHHSLDHHVILPRHADDWLSSSAIRTSSLDGSQMTDHIIVIIGSVSTVD